MIYNSKFKIQNSKFTGYTLLEIIVVVSILGVILAVITPNMLGRTRRASLESSLSGLAGDMKKARAEAMSFGIRTVLLTVNSGTSGPKDLNQDGREEEHYICFIDNDRNGTFTLNVDQVLYQKNWGNVEVVTNTLSPIIFLPQGTIVPNGQAPRALNIKFPHYDSEYSLELLSILGMTRIVRIRL
ncbi:MAG: GspH/FimT family pseudopilin [bacterium]